MIYRTLTLWLLLASLACAQGSRALISGRVLQSVEALRDSEGNPVVGNVWTTDQATTNTEAINTFLDELGKSGGKFDGLYIPGKSFAINGTLDANDEFGACVIYGTGAGTSYVPLHNSTYRGWSSEAGANRIGGVSELVWMGSVATDTPMLRLIGYGNVVHGVQFRGYKTTGGTPNEEPNDSAKVYAAIQIKRTNAGPNTGKNNTDGCWFIQCQRGYQFTWDTIENHADNHRYGVNHFHSTACCVELENPQSVGHLAGEFFVESAGNKPVTVVRVMASGASFGNTGTGDPPTIQSGGGKFHIGGLEMVGPGTIFDVRKTDANASAFHCDWLAWDANGLNDEQESMLVNMGSAATIAHFRIKGHFSTPTGGRLARNMVRLRGADSTCKLDVTNGTFIDRRAFGVHPAVPVDSREFDPGAGVQLYFDVEDAVSGTAGGAIAHQAFARSHSMSATSGVEITGPLVDTIDDQSGNGNDLTGTTTSRPKLSLVGVNRKPSLYFRRTTVLNDNVNRGLKAASSAGLAAATDLECLATVCQVDANAAVHNIASVWGASGNKSWQLMTFGSSATDQTLRLKLSVNGTAEYQFIHPTPLTLQTNHIVGFQRRSSDGAVVLWIDGEPAEFDTVDASAQAVPTGALFNSTAKLGIGTDDSAGGTTVANVWLGHISAALMGTTLSGAAELEYRMTELASRRGLWISPDFATYGDDDDGMQNFVDFALGTP